MLGDKLTLALLELKELALRRANYVQQCVHVSAVAPLEELLPRRVLPVTEPERAFLLSCAEYAHFFPDYSQHARQEPVYRARLTPASLCGDTGGIVHKDLLLIESFQNRQKCTRSLAYRRPRRLRIRKKTGLYSSIFYLPESTNVYHWLVDCLPRLYALSLDASRPLTLVNVSGLGAYQEQTLRALCSALPHITLATIGANERWDVEEYAFASCASAFNSPVLAPEVLAFMRRGLWPLAGSVSHTHPPRVYVARSAPARRLLRNEAEIWSVLEPRGFVRVELEKLSVAEQIALFRAAECVVGVHGAGLTNLLFSERAVAIELQAEDQPQPHYFLLCKALGLAHHRLGGSLRDREESFTAPAGELRPLLDRLGFSPRGRLGAA